MIDLCCPICTHPRGDEILAAFKISKAEGEAIAGVPHATWYRWVERHNKLPVHPVTPGVRPVPVMPEVIEPDQLDEPSIETKKPLVKPLQMSLLDVGSLRSKARKRSEIDKEVEESMRVFFRSQPEKLQRYILVKLLTLGADADEDKDKIKAYAAAGNIANSLRVIETKTTAMGSKAVLKEPTPEAVDDSAAPPEWLATPLTDEIVGQK